MEKTLHISVRYIMTGVVFLVLLFATNMFGQENFDKSNKYYECGIKNLIHGIKSDNTGLKRSSIYFAGKYKMKETVNVLTEQISKEKDENVRVLIALALYEIGDPAGFEAIKDLAATDKSDRVRRTSIAIVNR